ncbi:unnamed protein product [Triticum turgidum subsp. durum]|uniref:Uncharacterized protein n=1 Tax=Triticum turgidum subsp. durum TaxID=4567 RepID=A0A9R0R1B0_TRITD|nr:unnamed protein product [Triticum turgidum subsp. durum]
MDTGEQAGEESSANRRERLLALRSSAAAAAASSTSSSPSAAPPPPAWDLPEPDLAPTSSAPRPRSRFDFYTNPGAAFSSATAAVPQKRKNADPPGPNPAPAPPHGNYGNNYPPPHQHHMAQSPMEGAPGNSPWRSPMQFQTPMSGYRGTPPGPPPHWNSHSASPAQDPYPHQTNFGFRGPNVGRGGSPMNYGPGGSPMNYGPRGNPMNYGPGGSPMSYEPRGSPRSYVPRGSPHSSSGRGRGENYYHSPGLRGRGGRGGFQNHSGSQDQRNFYRKSMVDDPWQGLQPIVGSILPIDDANSWLPESLRKKETPNQGRGENYYHSPGSRGRGGRGGFQNHSGSQDQRNFYRKSMVDDPWQGLQPIVGNILKPIDGAKSWLPESLRKKETPNQGRTISNPTSGLSLAEYLASSFNEASDESNET